MKKFVTIPLIFITFLIVFSSKAKADCVGCGVDLLLFPAVFAGAGLVTSYTPAIFIEDEYEYSYSSTYWTGLVSSTAAMFTTALILDNSTDMKYSERTGYHFVSGLTGLLIGNAIGYYNSKNRVDPNLTVQVVLEKNFGTLNFAYRF